jgi:hypothetical protein
MQRALPLNQAMQSVDYAHIVRQSDMTSALNLCQSISGKADKVFARPGGIVESTAQWSRILGEAKSHNFPHDKLNLFMDTAGNEAPMLWLLHSRGYDLRSLRKKETETEQALREAQEQIAQLKLERQILVNAMHGKVAA